MTHDHCILCTAERRAAAAARDMYRQALVEIAACTSPESVEHELASIALAHEHGKPAAVMQTAVVYKGSV